MIRDITIGQYYPADSPLHRMDARVKIIITLLYIISLFVIKSFIGYAFVILCLAAVIKISKVPFRFMVKGLKALIFIIVFTAVINLVYNERRHGAVYRMAFYSYVGRFIFCHKNVLKNCIVDYRFVIAYTDDNTYKAYRRNRVFAETVCKNRCACPRHSDDDDNSA